MQQGVRSDTCGLLLIHWFAIPHTYTQRHTAHSGTDRLTHPYKYILTPPAMCLQQLSALRFILHWFSYFHILFYFLIHWFILLSLMFFPFKNYSLVEVIYLLIICSNLNFFMWNTNNTDRNCVNKQNTHTHTHTHTHTYIHANAEHSEKDNTANGVPTKSLVAFEFFYSATEASNDVTTFFNLKFITTQKLGLFWENITCQQSSKSRRFHWMFIEVCRK